MTSLPEVKYFSSLSQTHRCTHIHTRHNWNVKVSEVHVNSCSKVGHSWDATLTLLTCLHQHTWTDSMAEQQFSHDASQNKMRCSHTLQWLKLLCDTQCLFVSTKGKKNAALMKSKDPWVQVKALISYWFHTLNPFSAWSLQKDFHVLKWLGWRMWRISMVIKFIVR